MEITVQMQITFIPESSTGYTPDLQELNELVQASVEECTANLKEGDLARLTKCRVHEKLTEIVK